MAMNMRLAWACITLFLVLCGCTSHRYIPNLPENRPEYSYRPPHQAHPTYQYTASEPPRVTLKPLQGEAAAVAKEDYTTK